MERINQALEQARTGSTLHRMLDGFFVEQTANVVAQLKVCDYQKLFEHRTYLVALEKLELELLEYINKYNLMDARRQHVRDTE